ncbi:MBL fold metallo-hydrolase [Pseudalkalibacillus salsuginis]|uniref:MBL fold metallo-hydrolase n=1 Tax=Pseudalkalibacillus salsuginis TaxID=2910972 RepID=UPI001F2CEC5E|nr:MBL fold metallo-hydrolase [Pseudalkalibacillus salsuginis]MCF6409438.1 MBL fold metallo-hydrolase [Pseudalkalibacillus salsuginis]
MSKFICTTCGVQYPESTHEPESCPICREERQYVNPKGQDWTTLYTMIESRGYKNEIEQEEENLYSIKTTPGFGIGQTAYLVREDGFNVLWDCITYLDQKTIKAIGKLGGIDAIALSHPHYYSTQVEWAHAFDAPIYIHGDDRQWVMEPSERIHFWSGEELQLKSGITLHRLGGHFSGGAVLHWKEGNAGKGVLLTGDIIQVVADQNWVSFMYSYPNLIPLPARKVEDIANRVRPLGFDRIYSAFHKIVKTKANEAVQRSAKRYMDAIEGKPFDT